MSRRSVLPAEAKARSLSVPDILVDTPLADHSKARGIACCTLLIEADHDGLEDASSLKYVYVPGILIQPSWCTFASSFRTRASIRHSPREQSITGASRTCACCSSAIRYTRRGNRVKRALCMRSQKLRSL